jgi:phosphomannomutase
MTLIKSISGIRGTIGGKAGETLSPVDILNISLAYGSVIKKRFPDTKIRVVIGRDARISGPLVNSIVCSGLMSIGIDVIDGGLVTTPTVEIAVTEFNAHGGIIITASHNPKNWNALKLLNEKGEFISQKDGEEVLRLSSPEHFEFATVDKIGKYSQDNSWLKMHIQKIINLPLVDIKAIRNADFSVAIDCVNSVGGIAIPALLKALGVKNTIELFCEPNGIFPHNPEPLAENLAELSAEVIRNKANLGFAVDPDVDRLAIVCEDGEMFGEEYTLVAVADYILQSKPGNTVSNLSSTMALKDVTEKHKGEYFASAVGEVNVVEKMKNVDAVIGGEGNGGVIYPTLHYGRDALVGIALFLSYLAKSGKKCSSLKMAYPEYHMSKNKIELPPDLDIDAVMDKIANQYKSYEVNREDGIKITFDKEWVHLRKSNTEPIIRIYSESNSLVKADHLADKLKSDIRDIMRGSED